MNVCVIGPIVKDIVIINGRKSVPQIGGITYYAGTALAALGAQVTIIGSFAKEDLELFQKKLQDIILVPIYQQKTLTFTCKYTKKRTDTRRHSCGFEKNRITFEDILKAEVDLDSFDYVIYGPLLYENIDTKILENVRTKQVYGNFGFFTYEKDGKMAYMHPERVIEILPKLSFFSVDEAELCFIAQENNMENAIRKISQYCKTFTVTRGSKGSILISNSIQHQIQAYPPKEIVDPTGAGDSYLAGFLVAQELWKDPKKQGEFAARVATACIESKGATTITKKEVIAQMRI